MYLKVPYFEKWTKYFTSRPARSLQYKCPMPVHSTRKVKDVIQQFFFELKTYLMSAKGVVRNIYMLNAFTISSNHRKRQIVAYSLHKKPNTL